MTRRLTLYYEDGKSEEVTIPTAVHLMLTDKEMAQTIFNANKRVDHISVRNPDESSPFYGAVSRRKDQA